MPAGERQGFALALALALYAVVPHPAFFALVIAYVLALLALSWLDAPRVLSALPRAARAALAVVLAAPGVAALVRNRDELAAAEGLRGLPTQLAQRVRLEALPQIAPPLVSAAEPQTFFVKAQAHAKVRVHFGTGGPALPAAELGEGLYRLDYDPRRDGPPHPSEGEFDAEIEVDGLPARRQMRAVTPLAHPRWLARSQDATRAATTSEETDEVALVTQRGLGWRATVGDGPTACAFADDGHLAVVHRDDDDAWILDTRDGRRLSRIAIGPSQRAIAVSPDGTLLAVARDGRTREIVFVTWPGARVTARVSLEAAPDWIAFGRDAQTLVVATRDAALRRLRRTPQGYAEDAALPLGRRAVTLARALDGARLYVTTTDFRPNREANLGNHFVQDTLLVVDLARLQVQRELLTARRSPRQSKPGDVDRGVSPLGVSEGRDGSLLVAFAGTDELWRLRDVLAEPEITDVYDTPLHAPHDIVELADGTRVVSSPSAGALGLFAPSGGAPRVLRLAPDDDYLQRHDRDALARRLGEHGFYESTRSGISCQSCHAHGDSDEAAHNLGTHRLLPTLGVRGLLGTAPFLRDGSFESIAALDHVSETLYRGFLRRTPGRPQTLEAFVTSLPRRRVPLEAPRDVARERRGLRAFVQAGCPSCHAFPAFTTLGKHLMRSLFPERGARLPADESLDTPSLLSVGASAPYLSDGSARSLAAVLGDQNRSNRHGDSARLSPDERADLAAFLESL